MRAMDLDRANADAEIKRDDLIRAARHQSIENLALMRRERCDPFGRLHGFSANVSTTDSGQRRLGSLEQSVVAIGLFNEVDGTCPHRTNGALHIALAGHHDDRQWNAAL